MMYIHTVKYGDVLLHVQPPGSELTKHFQQLTLTTLSPLPVTTVLQCDSPFSIIDGDKPSHQYKVRTLIGTLSITVTTKYVKRKYCNIYY